jgi:hypothetical protein
MRKGREGQRDGMDKWREGEGRERGIESVKREERREGGRDGGAQKEGGGRGFNILNFS